MDRDIKRLEMAAHNLEEQLTEAQVFAEEFLTELERVRMRAQEILLDCIKRDFRQEIRNFCSQTTYQPFNVIAPIVYAFSYIETNSLVRGRSGDKEEESRRGSFSLIVVGETGSGKSSFIGKPLKDLASYEKRIRAAEEANMLRAINRIKALEAKEATEEGLTEAEREELGRRRYYIKNLERLFYGVLTPEKLLYALRETKMVSMMEDEGEMLIATIFARKSPSGLEFGSIINPLLDGDPFSYAIKSDPIGVDLVDYTTTIYCCTQEEVLNQAAQRVRDIANKMARFDFLFLTDGERAGVVMMGNEVLPHIETPLITGALKSSYDRLKIRAPKSDITIDLSYFLKIYAKHNNTWAKLVRTGAQVERIHNLVLKHRNRWGAYARGLSPMCDTEEDLSRAVGATLLLFLLNIIEYSIKGATARSVTSPNTPIEELLKKRGVYDLIVEALDAKRRKEGVGKIRFGDFEEAYLKVRKACRQTIYNFVYKLEDMGVLRSSEHGFLEVLDFYNTPKNTQKITYDFGLQYLLK